MAGSKFYGNQKVYVETDFDNVVLVDPNKIVNEDGTVDERLVNHENLTVYANLEARVIPRTKLAIGSNYDDSVRNIGLAQMNINFMEGKSPDSNTPQETFDKKYNPDKQQDKYFDTTWTDQILPFSKDGGNSWSGNEVDNQLLGITRISVKMNPAFVPTVTIEMTDVQGRVLFERGDQSPYSAFMQLPYPIFTLTLKGYYGKAIKLELMLKDFNARFDPSDGNYKITTNFIARSHAFLQDTLLDYLYATPHMYVKSYEVNNNTNGTTDGTVGIEASTTTKGMEKIKEVYSLYKTKGLIDEDFPEITLNQMTMRLEYFNRYVMEAYSKEDMSVLTDIVNYENDLSDYRRKVFINTQDSWFEKYVDASSKIVKSNTSQALLYEFKKELDEQKIIEAISELKSIIEEYNKKLKDNPTFYNPGIYTIENKKKEAKIPVNIRKGDIIKRITDPNDIDYEKTYTLRNGRPPETDENNEPSAEFKEFEQKLRARFDLSSNEYVVANDGIQEQEVGVRFIMFGDTITKHFQNGSFLSKLAKIDDTFKDKRKKIEEELSEALAKKIISSDVGLGFNPTINNVLAVICACAEGFYRLMDEVADNAWEERANPKRLSAIIPPQKSFGEDGKKLLNQVTTTGGTLQNKSIVYPWPQYFEEVIDENGDSKYEIKYPGQPSIASSIDGWNYQLWPEIEFVEEYIKASLEKDKPVVSVNYENETQLTNYISSNAIEFPFDSTPYSNKEYVSFFYEIFERTYLNTNYNKIIRNNNFRKSLYNVFADFESLNIQEGLKGSPKLTKIFKEYKFNVNSFNNYLSSISNNGQGSYYSRKSRDIFTQPYINNFIETDYGIYSIDNILSDSVSVIPSSEKSVQQLEEYISGTSSNDVTFLDVFPFTNLSWLKKNLADGTSVGTVNGANDTTEIMNFNVLKKTLATFDDEIEKDSVFTDRLLTYFDFITNFPSAPNQITSNNSYSTVYGNSQQIAQYYDGRENKDFYLTEGTLDYGTNYNTVYNKITSTQTTSLLNTPYFVNSFIKGVDNERDGVQNPYVGLGYMYLNSLPLPTLSEKFLTKNISDEGVASNVWSNYIYAGLSKFSAIHKIPYPWILKYGSIWHRYKEDKLGNGDILDGIWEDFDYVDAYDPINGNINKVYEVQNLNGGSYDYVPEDLKTTVSGQILSLNNGFYPKVINNTYRFFTGEEVLVNYDNTELDDMYTNGGFKSGHLNESRLFAGYDEVNPTRHLEYQSWFQYFDIDGNKAFDTDSNNSILVIPSAGFQKFNQSIKECLDNNGKLTQDIEGNPSVQNGNVRSLWGAPNYGYFNNQWVRKPNTNEYIKVIDSSEEQQNAFNLINKDSDKNYKSVEEIFSIFSKEMLDDFEKHFLNFCKKEKDFEDIVPNPSKINNDNYLGEFNVSYDDNIERVMKTLLFVQKNTNITLSQNTSGGENNLVKNITEAQTQRFVTKSNEFLNKEVILKIGNPGQFDRRVFDSFSSNEDFIPVDKIEFGPYVENTVPTAANGVTLLTSQTNHPEAWEALYLYVGEYVEDGLKYSDGGSYITDFFPEFNVEFTESNVIDLSRLIKVYASKKYNDNNLTRGLFLQDFESFMNQNQLNQYNMLNQIFSNLNRRLPSVEESKKEVRVSKLDGNTNKNEIWTVFKNMNDRWISGQDVKGKTLFEQFLFLDSGNRPIGDKVIINIEKLRETLKGYTATDSVLNLMGSILEDNNFVFMPTPTYANFFGRNERVKEGMPDPSYSDIANNAFGTFLEVDTHGSEPKFLAIYVGKVSEKINTSPENENYLYQDDAFDISKSTNNPLRSSLDGVDNFSNRNKVVAFNVDFGVRNQNMFKSISIDMSQRKNIAPTFEILAGLGAMGDGMKVAQQTASLYNFYKNSSYNCTVSSMGNAMIQPTMYFNLRYVPMFYGPYLITSVNHDITTRDFSTTFEGVRATKYSLQLPDSLVSSVNVDLVQNYLSDVRRLASTNSRLTESEVKRSDNIKNSTTSTNNKKQGEDNKCIAQQKLDKPYEKNKKSTINSSTFKAAINKISLSEDVKKYIFGVGYVETGVGQNLTAFNNNFFNLKNIKENDRWTVDFKKQTCVKDNGFDIPYLAFDSLSDSVKFMNDICSQYENIIQAFLTNPSINGDLAKSFTYIWYYTLRFTKLDKQINTSENIKDTVETIIATIDGEISKNSESKKTFDKGYDMFGRKINAWDKRVG